MESVFKTIGRILIVLFLLVQIGAMAYFANFTRHNLGPYFVAHGMDEDVKRAKQAYVYLCLSAILYSSKVMTQIRSIYEYIWEIDERECYTGFAYHFIEYGIALCAVVLECITINTSLRWWRYFEANDIGYFAQMSRGLFAMIITMLLIGICCIVYLIINFILLCRAGKLRPKRDMTAWRGI